MNHKTVVLCGVPDDLAVFGVVRSAQKMVDPASISWRSLPPNTVIPGSRGVADGGVMELLDDEGEACAAGERRKCNLESNPLPRGIAKVSEGERGGTRRRCVAKTSEEAVELADTVDTALGSHNPMILIKQLDNSS